MRFRLSDKRFLRANFILFPIIITLLIWSFRQLSWTDIVDLTTSLNFFEVVVLAGLNIFIFGLFTYRWAIIQSTLDEGISMKRLFFYRLIGFGISYFTPGPQIGGEPAQIILLKQNHNISSEKAISSVYLDRLIDVLVNFIILVFGLFVLINNNFFKGFEISSYFYVAIALLLIPLAYLILLSTGFLPLTILMHKINFKFHKQYLVDFSGTVQRAEYQMSMFIRNYPASFIKALLISIVSWGSMIFEYWLMLHFMGVTVNGTSLISAMTTARLAFLTPLPAGLGALEAGQVWVMMFLGLSSSIGISTALYIRIRDAIIGLTGLALASVLLPKRKIVKEVTV